MPLNVKVFSLAIFLFFILNISSAQETVSTLEESLESLKQDNQNLRHRLDEIEKAIDDILWFNRLGSVAFIDKVYITGPPLWKEENPTAMGYGNPIKFWTYIFIPKNINTNKSIIFIVFS